MLKPDGKRENITIYQFVITPAEGGEDRRRAEPGRFIVQLVVARRTAGRCVIVRHIKTPD
jgi:hypothetical protein